MVDRMAADRVSGWNLAREFGFLALRVAFGVTFMAHGAQKLFGWFGGQPFSASMAGLAQSLGVPAWMAGLAILLEFFGGLAVLLGIFTRTFGLLLLIHQLVAAVVVHLPYGFFVGGEQGPGIELNLLLGSMALFFLLAGPGRLALAGDTERRLFNRASKQRRRGRRVTTRSRRAA